MKKPQGWNEVVVSKGGRPKIVAPTISLSPIGTIAFLGVLGINPDDKVSFYTRGNLCRVYFAPTNNYSMGKGRSTNILPKRPGLFARLGIELPEQLIRLPLTKVRGANNGWQFEIS